MKFNIEVTNRGFEIVGTNTSLGKQYSAPIILDMKHVLHALNMTKAKYIKKRKNDVVEAIKELSDRYYAMVRVFLRTESGTGDSLVILSSFSPNDTEDIKERATYLGIHNTVLDDINIKQDGSICLIVKNK